MEIRIALALLVQATEELMEIRAAVIKTGRIDPDAGGDEEYDEDLKAAIAAVRSIYKL